MECTEQAHIVTVPNGSVEPSTCADQGKRHTNGHVGPLFPADDDEVCNQVEQQVNADATDAKVAKDEKAPPTCSYLQLFR